ncbi:pilus assembly PilX family protein [Quatrionicoccus australiensis]|uniref:pilus assembly PilX family protein n=1 Tax=Quatrionicoccus australiensis TaxID=138118 RepID=UPI001CF8AEE5|nr:PilX N-terminal domain-containing pilus assembly protein [Quatrionicoccus australiensis]UCV16321.1 hypothetical protein KI612_06380 [Quatrionicoccus australiensis]
MKKISMCEGGFALIVAMIILAVMSILVVSSVRNTTLSEKMSGSYLDRNLAQQAAEQALRQGEAILVTNGEMCASGCAVSSAGAVTSSAVTTAFSAVAWDESAAVSISKPTSQKTSAKYFVKLLPDSAKPGYPSYAGSLSGMASCKPYSVMGKGLGLDSRTVVILQTVALVCPV